MEQLEKVVKGLECCIMRDPDDELRCDICPYDGRCANRLKIDALSLINAQQERIKALEAGQQWISVKDRLPEPVPDEYLVVNGGKVQLAIFMEGMWITPHRVSSITHWMPLPEPPKEG